MQEIAVSLSAASHLALHYPCAPAVLWLYLSQSFGQAPAPEAKLASAEKFRSHNSTHEGRNVIIGCETNDYGEGGGLSGKAGSGGP